jgi:RND family efflux transporter MFP subunit
VEPSDAGLSKVRPLRQGPDAADERLRWTRFREAASREDFYAGWLAVQCHAIEGVEAGLVLARSPQEGVFAPAATWPADRRPGRHLAAAAERVLSERRALALQLDPQGEAADRSASRTVVAQPVEAGGEFVAVVALDVAPRPSAELERAVRQLAWGSAWLELHALSGKEGGARGERLEDLLHLIATPLEHVRFRAAATAFVTELATRFHCDRVTLGFRKGGHINLRAFSHSARFSERANVTRAIEAAMDEALDQEATLVWPRPPEAPPQLTRYHEELARESDAGAICSMPVAHGSAWSGVVTCERRGFHPFDAGEVELLEAAVALAGPTLAVQWRDERWLGARALESTRARLSDLVGPGHVALKLGTAIAVLLFAFLALAKGDFRVTAEMTLEARVLRAAVAPFDGYIGEAPVRAGDVVRAGDLLATLDDRELRLERTRWGSQLQQLLKQYRQAMAERDAAQVAILSAQVDQARAQLGLVEDRLAKTRIAAPFDGVVVTGDLSQELGAPVERGEVLFEVAPLDEYRVVLEVDERDIEEVKPAQTGTLAFTAFPDESFAFTVDKITPVSTPREGRNTFRVEARLAETPPRLRPGMGGVGKVDVDRRRLLWIWTHEATDWLRLELWNWLP